MSDSAPARAPVVDHERLPWAVVLAFSARAFFGGAMALLMSVYLGKFYIDTLLLPAGLLAVGLSVSRSFDALTDPVMGYISDYTRTRWGRRKPWILLGVLGNALTFYLLFVPRVDPATSWVMIWFLACYGASFLFVTISHIPRQALGKELTFDALERLRLFGVVTVFEALGVLLGAATPAVLAMGLGIHELGEQMRLIAPVAVIGYALTNLWLVYRVPERPAPARTRWPPLVPGIRKIFRNRPFRVLFTTKVLKAFPAALPAALAPFFLQYVLGVPQDKLLIWTGILILTYLGTGFAVLPIWIRLARRWGKRKTFIVASAIGVLGNGLTILVGRGDLTLLICFGALVGIQLHVWVMLLRAMQADVIDYDELCTGERREAMYVSLWEIIPKFAVATGTALGMATLGVVGYQPNVALQEPAVVWSLRIMFAVFPALFDAAALLVMLLYPLSETIHARVRVLVAQRAAGETVVDPISGLTLSPQDEAAQAGAIRLDQFSRRELTRFASDGRSPRGSVILWTSLSGAAAAAGAALVFTLVPDIQTDPGPLPTLVIIATGLATTAMGFHLLRLRPAREMSREPVERARVEQHLARLRTPSE
ncbi:MAG: MFS transporter [Myxococcales bacterium]|nr:MFS transporter [Myxococcales bacterium]